MVTSISHRRRLKLDQTLTFPDSTSDLLPEGIKRRLRGELLICDAADIPRRDSPPDAGFCGGSFVPDLDAAEALAAPPLQGEIGLRRSYSGMIRPRLPRSLLHLNQNKQSSTKPNIKKHKFQRKEESDSGHNCLRTKIRSLLQRTERRWRKWYLRGSSRLEIPECGFGEKEKDDGGRRELGTKTSPTPRT